MLNDIFFFRYDESLWRCVDMTKANLPSGLLGKVLKRGTRVLRLAQAKVCFCFSSLRKNLLKNRKVKGKKEHYKELQFFFTGKVNRQKLFCMTSSRSRRSRLTILNNTELLLNRVFLYSSQILCSCPKGVDQVSADYRPSVNRYLGRHYLQ